MSARGQLILRTAIAFALVPLAGPPAYAESRSPRNDMGVAAVDTRTGQVLWEAWRSEEIPDRTPDDERLAADYLLALQDPRRGILSAPQLPDFPTRDLIIKDPWPESKFDRGGVASEGKTLIYYRTAMGVIAFDRKTKKEAWRQETTPFPSPILVLEAGENRAFIQTGSDIPDTIRMALLGGKDQLRMRGLEPHTLKQRAAAAVFLHHYGDGYLRPEVRKLIGLLQEDKTDPAAEAAAKALDRLLADWPKKRDRKRLLSSSVAALLGTAEGNPLKDFNWPGAERVLAWALLQELIYGRSIDGYIRQGFNYAYHHGWEEQPVSLPEANRAKLADHCRKVAADGLDAEKPFAVSVLVSTAIGWNRLTDAERESLFLSSNPSTWRWAALALAKNGRREQLMEWTRERPADDHLDVIWVLKHNKPKDWSDQELAFWLACTRHNPGGVAYVLRLWDGPTPAPLREPIRSYLKSEIAKPTIKDGGTHSEGYLFAAVYLLDSWGDADDTPLLLDYLKHPVHSTLTRYEGAAGTMIRYYGLRDHVRALLEGRGVKIPSGVVYKEEVGPGKE